MAASQNSLSNHSTYSTEVTEPPLSASVANLAPLHWTPLGRIAFRIAFLYFFCFLFLYGNGSLLQIFPVVGDWVNNVLTWPMNQLAEWTGRHIFHLIGLAGTWHPTGSGDTALHWILNGLFLVFALAGGLLWTALAVIQGSRRTEYQTLYAWLRFLLRLTVGMFMVNYGTAKVYPLQMAPLSIAILNEPVGQSSPMTLLWSLIGMNPVYESICGFAEVLGGALILFRRTALAGALFSAFVLVNVVLYNFFFDVPVKLFAANLLLATLFVMLPDLGALFSFFWLHKPAAPAGVWVPAASRRPFRIAIRTVEVAYTIAFLVAMPILVGIAWHKTQVAARTPSPLVGAWHLEPIHPASGAFITGGGLPASDLYVDTVSRAFTRSTDGVLWRTNLNLNTSTHTISIRPYGGQPVKYSWHMPDPDHLTLTAVPEETFKQKAVPKTPPAVLTFSRTPTLAHYPLLDRGFHFVNEWGLER